MDQSPLDRLQRMLERVLKFILVVAAVAVFGGAIFTMFVMDDNSLSQGGRYYVALIALVILGAIDSQFTRLVNRRISWRLTTTPEERRYALVSLLLLFIAAIALFGLAWLLPS